MISILVRYGFRWHSDKPYRTRLRLVRYGLSECHLNPYRTRMDTICISYLHRVCANYIYLVYFKNHFSLFTGGNRTSQEEDQGFQAHGRLDVNNPTLCTDEMAILLISCAELR